MLACLLAVNEEGVVGGGGGGRERESGSKVGVLERREWNLPPFSSDLHVRPTFSVPLPPFPFAPAMQAKKLLEGDFAVG